MPKQRARSFERFFATLEAKSPCRVLSNFLDSFQGFVKGFRVDTTRELVKKVDAWETKKVDEAIEKGEGRGKIAQIHDKAETVRALCEDYTLVSDVVRLVQSLSRGTEGPTFSTIHKAKGLEAESVYIIRPDLVP